MAQTAQADRRPLEGRAEMEAQRSWAVRAAPVANRAREVVPRAREVVLRARAAQLEAARRQPPLGAHWLAAALPTLGAKRVLEAQAAPAARQVLEDRPDQVERPVQGERQAQAVNRLRQGGPALAASVRPGVPQAEAPPALVADRPAALGVRLRLGASRVRADPAGRRTSGTCRSLPWPQARMPRTGRNWA
jgi:hypothetical protein